MGYKKFGLLATPNLRRKPRFLLNALIESARARQISHRLIKEYQPCEILVLYGWGGDLQQKAIAQHNGRYIAFDLGYWDRAGMNERHWRVSIDGFHCPQHIMNGELPHISRLGKAGFNIADNRIIDGPILLIGNTPKSQKVITSGWTKNKSRELRRYFPDKKILYRAKPRRPSEQRVDHDGMAGGDLSKELMRCSLVVTRHSNVAVDACRLGVPVVCDDGAASAIYPSRLEDYQNQPNQNMRKEFLQRLAWWQWSINDIRAGKFWPWMESKLEEIQ